MIGKAHVAVWRHGRTVQAMQGTPGNGRGGISSQNWAE